ncbi:E3 ubiquitin-protein ligase DA2L-like [Macadamia integrifolia]|uniref:E3 ubiquitin-protein ligase DA2L-like n=1 Tax=Macadamia integrifolia TaxID=60698 RepID=UPI001C4EE6FE|nr:E3 ubiquitin-protein ligase DA2L-like [Macadamia integrifolia]
MGNRICRSRRSTVEDRFTRPQRLVREPSDFDYKKLRKLILSEKLAPCFDGVEESNNPDFEECPICFFHFPSLNRSKCCMKGICTECFLQMKPSSATIYAQCPFCKTPRYAVEYRGARTQEEKGLEQAEEQKVIEAKIRMQLRESQNGNQVNLVNQNSSPLEVLSTTSGSLEQSNGGEQNLRGLELSSSGGIVEVAGSPVNAWNERRDEFGLNLEEIMVMEAIWQSIQDTSIVKCTAEQPSRLNGTVGETHRSNQGTVSVASIHQQELRSTGLVTGGIAVAIARMAENNILHPENSQSIHDNEMVQAQNENSVGHQSCTPNPRFYGLDMLEVGPVTSDTEPDLDDVHSENACLASCYSTTEDDSWGLHSAYSLNGSRCSSDRSISDDELAPEEFPDVESSCLSSVHTISDSSWESPNCSDTDGRLTDSHLAVERHHTEFANNYDCYSMSHFRNQHQ